MGRNKFEKNSQRKLDKLIKKNSARTPNGRGRIIEKNHSCLGVLFKSFVWRCTSKEGAIICEPDFTMTALSSTSVVIPDNYPEEILQLFLDRPS